MKEERKEEYIYAGIPTFMGGEFIREKDIKHWRDYNDLHFLQCACKFTDTCTSEACLNSNTGSKRKKVKELIEEREWDFQIKVPKDGIILVKIPPETEEELLFIQSTIIDDETETKFGKFRKRKFGCDS